MDPQTPQDYHPEAVPLPDGGRTHSSTPSILGNGVEPDAAQDPTQERYMRRDTAAFEERSVDPGSTPPVDRLEEAAALGVRAADLPATSPEEA